MDARGSHFGEIVLPGGTIWCWQVTFSNSPSSLLAPGPGPTHQRAHSSLRTSLIHQWAGTPTPGSPGPQPRPPVGQDMAPPTSEMALAPGPRSFRPTHHRTRTSPETNVTHQWADTSPRTSATAERGPSICRPAPPQGLPRFPQPDVHDPAPITSGQ